MSDLNHRDEPEIPLAERHWHESEARRKVAEQGREAAEHQRDVAEEGRRSAENLRERVSGDWTFLQSVLHAADEMRVMHAEMCDALKQMHSLAAHIGLLVDEARRLVQEARADAVQERVAADEQRHILAQQYKALENAAQS